MTDIALYEPTAGALTTDRLRNVASNQRRFLKDRGRGAAPTLTERHIVAFAPQRGMVLLDGEAPGWARAFAADVNRIARLPHGWDSYGANRLKEKAVHHAIQLLAAIDFGGPVPSVAPTPDGDLRMEWTRETDELVLTVTAEGEVFVYLDEDEELTERELSIVDDGPIGETLRRFIG